MPTFADSDPKSFQLFERFTAGDGGRMITSGGSFNVFHITGGLHLEGELASSVVPKILWGSPSSTPIQRPLTTPPGPDPEEVSEENDINSVSNLNITDGKDDDVKAGPPLHIEIGPTIDDKRSTNDVKSPGTVYQDPVRLESPDLVHRVSSPAQEVWTLDESPLVFNKLKIYTGTEPNAKSISWHIVEICSIISHERIHSAISDKGMRSNWISSRVLQRSNLTFESIPNDLFLNFRGKTLKCIGGIDVRWFEEKSYKSRCASFSVVSSGLFDVFFGGDDWGSDG